MNLNWVIFGLVVLAIVFGIMRRKTDRRIAKKMALDDIFVDDAAG